MMLWNRFHRWSGGRALVALCLIVVFGVAGSVAMSTARGDDESPKKTVFFDGDYDAAKASAAEDERVLVLYFTATWCGPCRQMERTTWVDERVVELLTTKGLVFKIDVDDERALSRKYGVRAMPTMIAVRDGEVFDRVVGGRSADQMIEWFEGVRRGERAVDAQRRRLEEREKPGEHDVQGRYRLAQSLMRTEAYAEAMEHLVWLWDHSIEHEPAFVGVRGSFMLSTIEELCAMHPPAKAAFMERRDAAERTLSEGGTDWQVAWDFVALNESFGEPARTLAWFDANKDDATKAGLLDRVGSRLVPLLLEHERWADAGRLLSEPVQMAQATLPMQVRMFDANPDLEEQTVERILGDLALRHANEHAALFAAERDREAMRMAMLVANHLGNRGRLALARTALRAGVVRPIHLRLIDAIETDQPADFVALRGRIEAALGERDAE